MNNSFSFIEMLDNPQHSTKKELRPFGSSPKKRPPKLSAKKNLNRRLFTSQLINLLNQENENNYVSQLYDESINVSYFDQCFDIISKIGEGSFGEVYKVRSKDDGQFYAIKKSKDSFRGKSDRKQKIEEVRKYERIPNHENIIRLYNAWEQDNYVYLQMELGVISLEQFAEEHHVIPEERLWNILLDMLLALQNIHDCNLIHLDVKLENIIMCVNGTCKLSDFDLLTDLKGDMKNATEGDAKYLAPEMMAGKFTKAADVFSLGISMLELATDLDLPVYGKLWHNLRNAIYPTEIIKNVSKELMNIIRRMMRKDCRKRPSVKCLLRHPRMKSLQKQRREAAAARMEAQFSPSTLRASTPIPTTPPRNQDHPMILVNQSTPPRNQDHPMILVTQSTPPVGYSTPNLSLLLTTLDGSDGPRTGGPSSDEDNESNHSEPLVPVPNFELFESPSMYTHQPSRNGSLSSSAKKLNFNDLDM